MKLFDLRRELKSTFTEHNIDVVDVDFIVAEVLDVSHTELVLIDEVTDEQERLIRQCAKKRIGGTPVDKIFERAYFYGREFKINRDVLSPRQDSEIVVETAIKLIRDNNYQTCLDLCTGSGCLAITVQCETGVTTDASDISSKALNLAKRNAKINNAKINFIKSDMFDKLNKTYDIIISNPPYIATDDIDELDIEVKDNDPRLALDGGEFGLKYYHIIHDNLRKYLNPNGAIVLEIGDDQRALVESIFLDFKLIECVRDLGGNDRALVFMR